MRISTPPSISATFYAGIDTRAGVDDELAGFGIGRLYVGIYPTQTGFDVSFGILDENGCLN